MHSSPPVLPLHSVNPLHLVVSFESVDFKSIISCLLSHLFAALNREGLVLKDFLMRLTYGKKEGAYALLPHRGIYNHPGSKV